MTQTTSEYSIVTPKCLGITERTIIPPEEGWKENSYYVVDIARSINNVIHRAIFYTGFIYNKEPWGYNSTGVFNRDDTPTVIQNLFYCKAIRLIGDNNLN